VGEVELERVGRVLRAWERVEGGKRVRKSCSRLAQVTAAEAEAAI
jgi:hypothetical protein